MEHYPDLDALEDGVYQALKNWYTSGGTPADLLESLLLVQVRREELEGGNPSVLRRATNDVLLDALEELAKHDETKAQVLRRRFLDENTIVMVANRLSVSEHTVNRMQRAAIASLTEIVREWELELRQQRVQELEACLPQPEYSELFGVAGPQAELLEQLRQQGAPWFVAVVGLGGIGKTALADAVTRQIIREFNFKGVIFIRLEYQTMTGRSVSPRSTYEALIADLALQLDPETASRTPPERFAVVRQHLKARPYLVLVDNLEEEADTAFLLDHLGGLTNPSKFLLTSRTRLPEQTAVYQVTLDELGLEDAGALLRRHGQDIGVQAVAEIMAADVEAIYRVTGGNPLALRMVVSLLDVLPLPQALAGLEQNRPGKVENLYRRIYRRTWQTLSANARTLLGSMAIVSESGGRPDYLQAVSGLDDSQFWPAIQELRQRSLLEVRGTLHEKRYGIHRLTETFLRSEIIGWDDDDEPDEPDQPDEDDDEDDDDDDGWEGPGSAPDSL